MLGLILRRLHRHFPLPIMLRFPSLLSREEYGDFVLGPPLAPPKMTKKEAIAEATRVCPLLSFHRFQLQYGSYHDWSTRRGATQTNGTTTWQTEPAFDAWRVTVAKLSILRPAGRSGRDFGAMPGSTTRLVIVISDKVGVYYAARRT
jgi:hypothetical protein